MIGHNRAGRALILDAGALALSKDIGANKHLPDAGYGYVCDARTLARLGRLAVNGVHQEHGTVTVDDEAWFARLPVGSLVRVLPNHACITCAGYEAFEAVRGSAVVGRFAARQWLVSCATSRPSSRSSAARSSCRRSDRATAAWTRISRSPSSLKWRFCARR